MPSAMLPCMKWPRINLQRWRHPTHYFTIDYLAENYVVGDIRNLSKSCNYWSWYETLLTKHGDWFSSHPCIYIDFWFDTQSSAKNWPRSACHFAQILQEVVSAWLQAVQRSGHLQSSLVRCDFSQATLQLLGVGQWRLGRKLILYCGTLNSFSDTFLLLLLLFCHHPQPRGFHVKPLHLVAQMDNFFSKCRSRDLDSLPTETPSFPYAFYIFQRLIGDL